MWTQKGKILLFGVVSFYLIALVNESLVLYAVCSAGVALLGICNILARRSLRGLSCRRTALLDRLVEGGTLPVRMTVSSVDHRMRTDVSVGDSMRNLTSHTRRRQYSTLIREVAPNGEATAMAQYVCPERGRYQIGPVKLCGSDPFGLFQLEQEFELRDTVVAYPRTFDMPAGLLRGGMHLIMRDAQRSPSRGQGHEFRAIREYVQGDDLRWVHWKTTAHLGRLTIKEFESGAAASITILLDLSSAGRYGTAPDATVDYAARIASSVARDSILRGGFVRMCANAKSAIATPLDRGDAHLHRMLSTLAEVDANGDAPFSALVAAEQRSTPAGSDAILITALPDETLTQCVLPLLHNNVGVAVVLLAAHTFPAADEEPADTQGRLSRLRAYAKRLSVTYPYDPSELAQGSGPQVETPGPEEYRRLARQLRSLGVRVAVVEHGADLSTALSSIVRWHGAGAVGPVDRRLVAASPGQAVTTPEGEPPSPLSS
jgi:uncharacterized protein (DUF58 family)